MTTEERLHNLEVPRGPIDVVLDTDAYNEIDDQFALAYLLRAEEKLRPQAIYAAPFFNANARDPKDGMEKSYTEIQKILRLAEKNVPVFKGSEGYLPDERTPVLSPAAQDLAERALRYSPQAPLYVVAIGAITNIASALLLRPEICENIVVVWLGGHAHHFHSTVEFNMKQDIAAARVVMQSGAPFVQLPCMGVVSAFTVSGPELRLWLSKKNPLADYLAENTIKAAESYAAGRPWTRVIWDVTAVAWLLNEDNRFLLSRVIPLTLPTYDHLYSTASHELWMRYVYFVNRDVLFKDLIDRLTR